MAEFKPAQMFDHELSGAKGWPGEWAIDKAVDLDPTEDHTAVKAGRGAHMDPSTKKFKLGPGTVSATAAPPIFFLFQNGTDHDVVGPHGNIVGAQANQERGPKLMGLACTGDYELDTTEYVDGTYNPGSLLDVNASGELKVVTGNESSVVCGVVSDGLINHEHKPSGSLLRFLTCYLPRLHNV